MALEMSSAGVRVAYCVETTAGTRPTSGYTLISNIKSVPDLNPQPSQLDCTDLSDEQFKRYIPGLQDTSGSIAFSANNTNTFLTEWAGIVTAFETAHASNKSMWFEIRIPKMTNSFFFSGEPTPLGLGAIEVDQVLTIDAYITPNKIVGWATKSTTAGGST